jgi:hypothetical protein
MNLSKLHQKYYSYFDDYQKSMGASFISIDYCMHFLNKLKPVSILDAGSGFSSIAFHSICQNVTTVDDDQDWGKKTIEILNSELKKNIVIKPLTKILDKKFDFVFYDYGDIETRIYYFETVLHLCTGIIYLDDFHVSFYRDYISSRAKNFEIKNLEDKTGDEFGRYGALLIKNKRAIDVL